ncbi:DnaD domain-containing protein [Oceanobacillus luteolus]|uniref:DnaD domain-containing protein n=1 Tax=Oceanobacillus luteolus TaxID=1274358 RepID=A0ABW4HTX7_9BACI
MNYIKEINAFYDLQEQTPLSGSAIALWYALMHINNKTRWKNRFTSPGSVLRNKAGLTESSFKRARAELESLGYIEVESQGRGKAPVYKMNSLVVEDEEVFGIDAVFQGSETEVSFHGISIDRKEEHILETGDQEHLQSKPRLTHHADQSINPPPAQNVDDQLTDTPDQLVTHLPDHKPAPLYKQYINKTKTKRNNINASAADTGADVFVDRKMNQQEKGSDAIVFYQENFGLVGPFVAESLQDWIQTLGEELVIEAMKRALERNKTSWGYVKSILNDWYKKGIRTVGEAEAELVAFENERREKKGLSGGFFVKKRDIIPEWYGEEERKRKERELEKKNREEEVTVEQVEEVMRRYWEEEGEEVVN